MNQNSKTNSSELFAQRFSGFSIYWMQVVLEIISSTWKGKFPLTRASLAGIVLGLFFLRGFDNEIIDHYGGSFHITGFFRLLIASFATLLPFLIMGAKALADKKKALENLAQTLDNAGLRSRVGLLPKFVSDLPIDDYSRKLTLHADGIPLKQFRAAIETLESGLNAQISRIDYVAGTLNQVEIVYFSTGTAKLIYIDNPDRFKDYTFPIGYVGKSELVVDIKEIPHLLVAGTTGTGKSSFLRMLLGVLVRNNPGMEVDFFDLKNGDDIKSYADDIPQIRIWPSSSETLRRLEQISDVLAERSGLFQQVSVANISAYNQKIGLDKPEKHLGRLFLVVDEASDLSTKTSGVDQKTLKNINSHLINIVRKGRSYGIHVIVGTQKPDSKNLDTTIKANLPGILCFYVNTIASSVNILGNSRAVDLNPNIAGRAIWQYGPRQQEVQVPFLTLEEAQKAVSEFESLKAKRNSAYVEDGNPQGE